MSDTVGIAAAPGKDAASALDDGALQALATLIVVLADNELFHGLRIGSWATGAPNLEAAVACAAIAQDKLGHSRALYPLLDELQLPTTIPPAHPADNPKERYALSYFDEPFSGWPQVVAALALVSPAINLLLHALVESAYTPLARRAQHVIGEEALTTAYAAGLVRDLVAYPGGKALLQREVDRLLPELLCWFGPVGEGGFDTLVRAGLIDGDNETLRQIAPLLQEGELALPFTRDAATGAWAYAALPWEQWNRRRRRLVRS
jgi:1,2-phenylacetyl-CoA epoxidase catalytic subunit